MRGSFPVDFVDPLQVVVSLCGAIAINWRFLCAVGRRPVLCVFDAHDRQLAAGCSWLSKMHACGPLMIPCVQQIDGQRQRELISGSYETSHASAQLARVRSRSPTTQLWPACNCALRAS